MLREEGVEQLQQCEAASEDHLHEVRGAVPQRRTVGVIEVQCRGEEGLGRKVELEEVVDVVGRRWGVEEGGEAQVHVRRAEVECVDCFVRVLVAISSPFVGHPKGRRGDLTISTTAHATLKIVVVFDEQANPRGTLLIAGDSDWVRSVVVEFLRDLVREPFDLKTPV